MEIVAKEYLFKTNQTVISSQALVHENIFTKHPCGRGTWYVATTGDRASNIFFSGSNKTGMGGSTLPFELEDGSIDFVKGPWMGNTDSLFRDTGVDLRNQHLMRYIICRDIEHQGNALHCRDVIKVVDTPTPMAFDDCEVIAQKLADQLGEVLRYSWQSHGGGCVGFTR